MTYSARRVTREEFQEIGEWARVEEFWGLQSPRPALHVQTPLGLALAHIGDWIIHLPGDLFFVQGERSYSEHMEET